jgi:excisionase family DNA binding protein
MTAQARPGRHRAGRITSRSRLVRMNDLLTVSPRDSWFTTDSLAERLQVSDRLIRKWVAEGRLRSYKLDGCRRFSPEDVERFVEKLRDVRRAAR